MVEPLISVILLALLAEFPIPRDMLMPPTIVCVTEDEFVTVDAGCEDVVTNVEPSEFAADGIALFEFPLPTDFVALRMFLIAVAALTGDYTIIVSIFVNY